MTEAVIVYDNDLPEIPGRLPWEMPMQHLVKDVHVPTSWKVEGGRRPSKLLLVPKIRIEVDAWRASGYEGASEVTRRLFEYWFEEDHEVLGFNAPFRYYFCQREAIETLAWLIEIANHQDAIPLIKTFATKFKKDLFSDNIVFQTTMDDQRQISRYVPELGANGVQDLPPENLRRFAFKMATGSGKTWVMAMAIVWARLHKQKIPDSPLSTNFLIIAPNVIVYQRLEKDFAYNRIFHELPLVPPEWRSVFSQKVILRGETTEPDSSNNLFLTNIHQLYESRDEKWMPTNAVETLLGKKPVDNLTTSNQRSMLERIKSLKDLIVMNDEAHHVHEESLAWNQSLLAVHKTLPHGVATWLDFSATPKDQRGMFFPWVVCDYPLAQAVEDRIVKAPLIVTKESDPKHPIEDPDNITKENVAEKYGYWLEAAVKRWKEHRKVYKDLDIRPVLFVTVEKNAYADALGKYLWENTRFGFKESEVLIIHTDASGDITKKDLDKARQAARDVDEANGSIKVVVSVMMLREGWDVRNVTVILGLRPFTAKAEILPEQIIGRGLRLMPRVSPDRTQTLEVLGTRNLLKVLREQLEAEGVGVVSTKHSPPIPVTIKPLQERITFDINIPITRPSLTHDLSRLSNMEMDSLTPIYDLSELKKAFRVRLTMEFATTETEVHRESIATELLQVREILSVITNKVANRAKLPNHFAELYPIVRDYLTLRCFGRKVDLDDEHLRSHLARPELQDGIAKYLARKISELTIERREIEFENIAFHLSETNPFNWRRDLPPLEAKKTVFNFVATYNQYERYFAEFLDSAWDVARFSALGTTEQGASGSCFRIDYLKPSGAIGFYYPDWVAVQSIGGVEVNWIIETKGRVWEDTEAKDVAMREWCRRVSVAARNSWRYIRINQADFNEDSSCSTLGELIARVVSRKMFAKRDQRITGMSQKEVRQARDEGRP